MYVSIYKYTCLHAKPVVTPKIWHLSSTAAVLYARQGAILGALEGCDAVIHLAADGRSATDIN